MSVHYPVGEQHEVSIYYSVVVIINQITTNCYINNQY